MINDLIHPEILNKFYGCGTPLPPSLEKGMSVVDLGCGTGRDVYLVSYFVGKFSFRCLLYNHFITIIIVLIIIE